MSRDGSRVYGFRRSDPPIVEFDRAGRIVRQWGRGMFAWPRGLHVDRDGFIWATDATIGPGTSAGVLARMASPWTGKAICTRPKSTIAD